MIVKIMPASRRFSWLAQYLLSPGSSPDSPERVAWTETRNLAADSILDAAAEMERTFEGRDLLLAEAGLRRRGPQIEKPVKHIVLAWPAGERPSQTEMMAAAESLLKKLSLDEHQCAFVAHSDRRHSHLHVMASVIDPETGVRANDAFERRRAQEWALGWEITSGKVVCEERLKPIEQREKSPPRSAWEILRDLQSAESDADAIAGDDWPRGASLAPGWQGREWVLLKEAQKEQRLGFFAGGKAAYRDARNLAYREVRQTYRHEWREFYLLKRSGAGTDVLAEVKADLVARQSAALRECSQGAATELRSERDAAYRELLDRQKADRGEMIDRQERGLASPHLTTPAAAWAGAQPAPRPVRDRDREEQARPTGLTWALRPGMVAQQRSALRWLDRAANHVSQPPPSTAPPGRLAAAAERIAKKDKPAENAGPAAGIEPDMAGGMG